MTSNSSDRPLSVLILTPEYPPNIIGGLGTHVCEVARGLARAGHRVHVVITALLAEPRGGDEMDEGFDVHLHHVPVIGKSRANDTAARALEVIERYGPPDIVHCHDHFFVPAALRLRRTVGTTVVGTVHLLPDVVGRWIGGFVPGLELLERMFCTSVDRLIAVSGALGQLCHDVHGVPLDRIDVVHNAFDPREFLARPGEENALAALRAELCRDHEKLVLFAGRLCWQKGIDGFLEAAEVVVGQRNDVRYVVAGAAHAEYEPTLNQLLERHAAVRPHLTMLGMIPRGRLASLYRIADLAVVPSLYEPFGYAAVEALAAGCPVVATDVGGLPEIFSYPDHPALVEVDKSSIPHRVNSAMLAAVQLDVLDHPERARREADAGRHHVLTTFTVERMVAETVATYRRAMAARGTPRPRPPAERA